MKTFSSFIEEQPIFEMAHVNAKDTSGSMPISKYKVEMRSNDHNPPHVHILFDGNDVSFKIEDGSHYKTDKDNGANVNKLEKIFNQWLSQKSKISEKITDKDITNKEYCLMLWNMWH